jgi:hypothetical protein
MHCPINFAPLASILFHDKSNPSWLSCKSVEIPLPIHCTPLVPMLFHDKSNPSWLSCKSVEIPPLYTVLP